MPPTLRLCLLALLASTLVAGCGGGSSGGGGTIPVTPPTPTNTAPVARIAATSSVPAGTVVSFDGTASSDAEGSPLSFTWTVAGPAGSTAALVAPTTARPSLTPDVAGNYTLTLTVNDGSLSSAPATAVQTVTAAVPPTITLDKAEPLEGSVQLSLTGTVSGSVSWYMDLVLLGNGSGTGNTLTWNTTTASNGQHLLVARIQTGTNAYQEIRRTVTVSNSSITLSATASGTTGTINVDVRATSTFGITRVSGSFDNGPPTVLTSPNACSRFCSGANDVYRFTVDAAAAGSGNHSLVVTALDGSGSTRQLTVAVPVSNAPVITLLSPSDGTFVYGSLTVVGTATTDKPGGLTVTARLGDVQFLSSTQSNFIGSYDLTGVAPGSYTLTLTSTDATGLSSVTQRTLYVTSTNALAYQPRFTLPAGASLLAAQGTQVLYTTADKSVVLRDLLAASEVTLAGAAGIQYVTGWRMDGGRVVAYGKGADCVNYCIYLWSANGSRSNLSTANPYSQAANIGGGWAYDLDARIHGDYVLWINDKVNDVGAITNATGRYTLYQISTNTYTRIGVPQGVNYLGNNEYDFSVTGTVVDFWFWGQTGGEGGTSQFDIYRWKSDSGTTQRMTNGGSRNIYPQVDSTRVVWQQSPVGGNSSGLVTLLTQSLTGGSSSTLSTTANSSFQLRDGVVAWTETNGTAKAVKAATSAVTSTLSALTSGQLLATGSGYVVYGELGKVYSWNSSGGASTLRIESAPGQVFVTGGAMIFTMGNSVYRVTLN